jgi:hypothetical protein
VVSLVALYWSGRIAELSERTGRWLDEAVDAGDRRLEFACRTMHCYAHLRTGDPRAAMREIERARGLGLDYVQGAGSDPWWVANVALYAGDPAAALAACDAQRPHYGLYARYSSTMRALWAWTDGQCAAALARVGPDRGSALRTLTGAVDRLQRSRARAARPAAAQLGAALSLVRGDRSRALGELETGAAAYATLGMTLHAAALSLALARLGARDAPALERAALAAFAAQGIQDPERWANMIAPGFPWVSPRDLP